MIFNELKPVLWLPRARPAARPGGMPGGPQPARAAPSPQRGGGHVRAARRVAGAGARGGVARGARRGGAGAGGAAGRGPRGMRQDQRVLYILLTYVIR